MEPKERFTHRVENYDRFRPSYPKAVFTELSAKIGFASNHIVAEIGSGTGKFTELLLKNGNRVYAVEPNPQMREVAERSFSYNHNFFSLNGSAEETNLPKKCVDHIFAAQSFHWFDIPSARTEFQRVLKPNGHVILLWNIRDTSDPFMNRIESLITQYSNDYDGVGLSEEKRIQKMKQLFEPNGFESFSIENKNVHTPTETIGYLKSASYIPLEGTDEFEALQNKVKELYSEMSVSGTVDFVQNTQVFYGKLVNQVLLFDR